MAVNTTAMYEASKNHIHKGATGPCYGSQSYFDCGQEAGAGYFQDADILARAFWQLVDDIVIK